MCSDILNFFQPENLILISLEYRQSERIDAMKTDSNSPTASRATSSTSSTERYSPSPDNVLEQLRDSIKLKASQGDYQAAIALLNRAIALCPDSAIDYNNRGLMYYRDRQIPEALKDLSRALEIDPNLDSAYNNRANCHAIKGDLVRAIADYDTALDLNPANIRAWINQGIAFRELRMYDLALENFDITLIIGDSLHGRIYAERGRTYHLQGDWNCAVADYQTALVILSRQLESSKLTYKVRAWLDRLLFQA